MPPVVVAAGIGAAAGIGGSMLSGSAQKKAAKTAAASADRTAEMNNALQRDIYGQNKQLLAPYVNAGIPATGRINAMLGLGGDQGQAQQGFRDYISNSDYGFQLGEGSNALNHGYAAQGAVQSGAAMKELERFRQNLQAGYRNEYLGHLGNQQGMGMSAASATAGVGQGYANSVQSNNNIAGSANANAALFGGAAKAQMYGGIANSLGNFAGSLGSSFAPSPYARLQPAVQNLMASNPGIF